MKAPKEISLTVYRCSPIPKTDYVAKSELRNPAFLAENGLCRVEDVEALRKDKERLDWVLKFCDIHVIGDSFMICLIPERPSIDKAMQGEATE